MDQPNPANGPVKWTPECALLAFVYDLGILWYLEDYCISWNSCLHILWIVSIFCIHLVCLFCLYIMMLSFICLCVLYAVNFWLLVSLHVKPISLRQNLVPDFFAARLSWYQRLDWVEFCCILHQKLRIMCLKCTTVEFWLLCVHYYK